MRSINYKRLHLNKFGIPNAKSLMLFMLKIASFRSFWKSRDLRISCENHLIMPDDLKELTFKTGSHPGTNRLDYNLSWSLHNLYKHGALSQVAYATYQITKLGKIALKNSNNYSELDSYLKEYNHRSNNYKKTYSSRNHDIQISNIYERIDNDIHKLNNKLKGKLLNTILHKNPYFFEKLVVILLSKMGYKGANGLAKQTQKSRDGGIDGIIRKDPLGTSTIYIQAKRYRKTDKVDKNDIKNFYVSVKDRHSFRGVFITTSSFNSGARHEAKRHSIILIDGNELTNLMIKYNVGVQVRKSYNIYNLDRDFFS